MNRKIAQIVAALFFTTALLVALAAADHPPPPGFLALVILLAGAAGLIHGRVIVYLGWQQRPTGGRMARVLRDGLIGGAAAGVLLTASSPGEPGIRPELMAHLIGLAALLALGVASTLAAWFTSSFLYAKLCRKHPDT